MSGDPDQEYFADGLVEDIITELSRFRDCRHPSQLDLLLQKEAAGRGAGRPRPQGGLRARAAYERLAPAFE